MHLSFPLVKKKEDWFWTLLIWKITIEKIMNKTVKLRILCNFIWLIIREIWMTDKAQLKWMISFIIFVIFSLFYSRVYFYSLVVFTLTHTTCTHLAAMHKQSLWVGQCARVDPRVTRAEAAPTNIIIVMDKIKRSHGLNLFIREKIKRNNGMGSLLTTKHVFLNRHVSSFLASNTRNELCFKNKHTKWTCD